MPLPLRLQQNLGNDLLEFVKPLKFPNLDKLLSEITKGGIIMKKIVKFTKLYGGLLIVLLCLMFGANTALAEQQPIVLKIAHQGFPPHVFINATSSHWGKLVKERTNGEVELKFFYDTLAKGPGILTAAQQGVADGYTVVSSFLSGRVKALNAFEINVNAAPDQYPEVVSAIRPVMDKILAEQGLKHCGSIYSYKSVVYTHKSKHYHKPDDFKGTKLRLPGLWGQKQLKIWGGSPVMILPPEIYTSAQRGIIDGVVTINMLVDVFKLYEVTPYITEMPNSMGAYVIFGLNMNTFNKLNKKHQDIIIQAGKDAELFSYDYGRKQEDELQQKLSEVGKYYVQTAQEYQAFVDIAQTLVPEVREYSGPLGQELMDAIQKVKQKK
jgi:TRAP-type C4-dicarboxylate transport system substrate-binding protein